MTQLGLEIRNNNADNIKTYYISVYYYVDNNNNDDDNENIDNDNNDDDNNKSNLYKPPLCFSDLKT